jgi:hypothetical protein
MRAVRERRARLCISDLVLHPRLACTAVFKINGR